MTVVTAVRVEPAAAQVSVQPNILLIVLDDMRPETLEVMPATRRFFQRSGVSFPNAFTVNPLCCPARVSIMTGRYAHNHGIRRNEDSEFDENLTLQGYLQRDGYITTMAGKYLNGWPEVEAPPPFFDRWAVIDDSRYGKVYRGFQANVDGRVVQPSSYSTRFVARHATRFLRDLEAEDDRPWFMYLAPFSAHWPYESEDRYVDAWVPRWPGNPAVFEEDRTDKPPWVQDRYKSLWQGRWIAKRQSQALMSADDMVARVFSKLAALDEKRDTLAFFVSDSGYLWAEHRTTAKRLPYTPAVRVPLMMRWPGQIPRGVDDRRIAATIDIAPTVLEVTGVPPDTAAPPDGRSLLANGARESILVEFFGSRIGADIPQWAALHGLDHHYIEYLDSSAAATYREFYDLVADPFELQNLYGDDDPANDPAPQWSVRLDQARACSGPTCP